MELKNGNRTENISGFGFLCYIKSKNIRCLVTYNHIINLEFLNSEENLIFYDYYGETKKEIDMKSNRFKYTNEALDITIIEFNEDIYSNYIDIDENFDSKDYKDEEIYLIEYNERKIKYLNDKVLGKENGNLICSKINALEGIILLKENLKLIGIVNKNKKEKIITSMSEIINKINFIICEYDINYKNLEKEIQIINNSNESNVIKNEEIAKNIKIIVDGKIKQNCFKYKFKNKYFFNTIYILSEELLTNLSCMFYGCSELYTLDLSSFNSSFNTSQVVDMSYMFYGCSGLKQLNLSSINTSQVVDMSYMFYGCSGLEELDLSSFNTNQVINMSSMFSGCSKLGTLNLSKFNTDKLTDMSSMFSGCSELFSLDLPEFYTDKVTNMSSMFSGCSRLFSVCKFSYLNTDNVTDMSLMFSGCSNLWKLDLSKFNTDKVNKYDKYVL